MDSVEIYLWCIGICFIPLAVVNIYRNGIQGLGYGLLPMMAGVAELVGRGAVAVAAAKQRSYTGVCMASPAAWILAGSLLLVMYYYIMKVESHPHNAGRENRSLPLYSDFLQKKKGKDTYDPLCYRE